MTLTLTLTLTLTPLYRVSKSAGEYVQKSLARSERCREFREAVGTPRQGII